MSSDRPPFILGVLADLQGCGTVRMSTPLGSLVEAGVADGKLDMSAGPLEMLVAMRPDTIVWQRQVEDSQIASMAACRAALPDALFVYELDDYLGEIPRKSFHAGFMPPNLPAQISKALVHCDRVTTSTEPLAEWLRELGGRDVRVVQNALPAARLMPRERQPNAKLRIGFAGGISHEGDLDILRQAIADIGDAVQWVFLGMKPRGLPVEVEFHEGVQPLQYLDKLASLNMDLLLAPLEANMFNRCKSNLRLLESAAAGAAVIAQHYVPYLDGDPPVFGYATTPEQWSLEIKRFISMHDAVRKASAEKLLKWVAKHHTLEGRLKARLDAWTKGEIWRPKQAVKSTEAVVIAASDEVNLFQIRHAKREEKLVDACRRALSVGADVLWLRPGAKLADGAWDNLRLALMDDQATASAVPLATDGPNAFPKKDGWTMMSDEAAAVVAEALREVMRNRLLNLAAASGPVVLLSKNALAMGGIPDVEGCDNNEEVAILEWGLRLATRGWHHVQAAGAFAWGAVPPVAPSAMVGQRFQARAFINNIKTGMEELSAADRAAIECRLLRKQWAGPRLGCGGFDAGYVSWSLLRGAIAASKGSVNPPKSLKHVWLKHFGVAWDDLGWLVFVDENVTLKADALASFDAAIEAAPPETLVVYADHDTRVGDQLFPEFKGKLDIEFLLAKDYVTPICAVKASLFTESPEDRSSLYAVVLKAALEHGADVFVHVPEVLATLDGAASPEAAALNALQRQLVISEALGRKAHVVAHRQLAGNLVVRRRWQEVVEAPPKITVIIPTLGAGRMIQPCVNTLLQHTAYPNFEVLVVVNGARDEPELGAAANDPRVTVARWKGEDGFNWSALNNSISGATTGDFLLFLNDDINVASMERDWLDLMMGHAVLEDVGAVGARLIHPAGFVQHVGVVVHNGIAAHLHMGLPNGHPGSDGKALLTHEASAVTGAAMLVSRKKFNEVGGFDEAFPLDYNDVDFCMKLRQRGYRNVVEMGAELMHSAAATRGAVATAESFQDAALRLAQRWAAPDPYWSPNLALGLAPNGMIQGLNCDILAWEDPKAAPTAQRVLIINDARGADSHALAEMRLGHIPFMADVSGFGMALIAPSPLNMGLWDIRKPADIEASLKALGIEQIVLRSLVGVGGAAPPVELLKCLAAVRMPTQVIPVSNELVAPWLDPNWDASTSPFGHSDVASWRAALSEFWPYLKMEEAAE